MDEKTAQEISKNVYGIYIVLYGIFLVLFCVAGSLVFALFLGVRP